MNSNNLRFLQTAVYTRKFFRTLLKESLISIIIGIIITVLVMIVTGKDMFEVYEGTKSGFFSLVCVCIWIGIFNSIQLVCREKNDIVKDELDKSLHASSYIAAHYIFQIILSFVQSVIVFAIFYTSVSGSTYFMGNPVAYLITIFLLILSSDALALVISCAVPSPVVAMTVMPLILLIQLVMAGVLFELKGFSTIISFFTMSKWGMSAFGTIGNITRIGTKVSAEVNNWLDEEGLSAMMSEPYSGTLPDSDVSAYGGDFSNVIMCWTIMILFTMAFFALSVLSLKLTTRKLKK